MRYFFVPLLTLCLIVAAEDKATFQDRFLDTTGVSLNGFLDYRNGTRLASDDYHDDASINELRLQLELQRDFSLFNFTSRGDLLYNELDKDRADVDLETGEGWFDLREFNATFYPTDWIDLKIGRQILTWGTGEYLFINDLFPKDWQSFFLGRDNEYLKAPSDAIMTSAFFDTLNLDIVFTPRFDADRYITGQFLTFYDQATDSFNGENAVVDGNAPDRWLKDYELAIRAYKNIDGYEAAAYFYNGFWKSPAGFDPVKGQATFPDLQAYGASLRGAVGSGIGNIEIGYYHSKDDKNGTDPFTSNSEFRCMFGYQRELGADLTLGLQYYLEWMMDYSEYKSSLPDSDTLRDEFRHLTTVSLNKLLFNQNLRLWLFAFYSPSDEDCHIKSQINYKYSDSLSIFAGANLFLGSQDHTFFNQFESNCNIYLGVRTTF